MDYKHWTINTDEHNICWLLFDYQDASTNVLATPVLNELNNILDNIDQNNIQAVVFKSAKTTGFIAGANIKEFVGQDYKGAHELITLGHEVMNKIEALKCNTISLIHGFSMGGGTELALACNYIICSTDDSTKLALPEVKLGIHPGFGGSLRSIRRVGPLAAFDMMLTGRTINTRRAKKIKLIDEVTAERQLERAAISFAAKKYKRPKQSLQNIILNNALVRGFIAGKIRKQVAQKAPKEQYPAP